MVTTLPSSREDDYTVKGSAHSNNFGDHPFVYTLLSRDLIMVDHVELRKVTSYTRTFITFTRTFRPIFSQQRNEHGQEPHTPPKAQGADAKERKEGEWTTC